MAVTVSKHSRLNFAELLAKDGFEFWDLPELPDIPAQPDDLVYTVLGTDRIDRLAGRYYGDPVLWWVIALANNLDDVPTALCEGQQLRIPAPRYVLQELFKR